MPSWKKSREVCRQVPAHAPRNFREALQILLVSHLAVVTELNTWDSFCPGHLDQHLYPLYQREIDAGSLTVNRRKSCSSVSG